MAVTKTALWSISLAIFRTRQQPSRSRLSIRARGLRCCPTSVVLFCGDRRISVCSIVDQPALFQTVVNEELFVDYFTQDCTIASYDGRTLIHQTGRILSVSR